MKKILLTSVITWLSMLLLSAQSAYVPMIVQGNQWNELVRSGSIAPEYRYERTYITKLGQDTLINDTIYYQLLHASDSLSSNWTVQGYVREDVQNRKVFFRPHGKSEAVLCDFGVSVGDTIRSRDAAYGGGYWDDEVRLVVREVDEITIDGKLRKQIKVQGIRSLPMYPDNEYQDVEGCEHIWIEGIGNMNGLLFATTTDFLVGSAGLTLQCFFQNDELIYKPENTGISECFVWRYTHEAKVEPTEISALKIFPNPVEDYLTIVSPNHDISLIEIFDGSGRKIYVQRHAERIDFQMFTKGVYVLKMHDVDGNVSVFKIVKR